MREQKTALITGATSGIGRAFAREYAAGGYALVLTGRRQAPLEQTAAELREKYGVLVELFYLELSDRGCIETLQSVIAERRIEVLINNAGFGVKGYFQEEALEDYLRMIQVHVVCATELTRAVLPQMLARDSGVIINVASDAAMVIVPGNAVYSGTKAYLKQFTEGLFLDLRCRGSHVTVQALCPGLTRTDFQLKMGMTRERQRSRGMLRWQEPEAVVSRSLRWLARNRPVCLCGGAMGALEASLAACLPKRLYYRLILKLFPPRASSQSK